MTHTAVQKESQRVPSARDGQGSKLPCYRLNRLKAQWQTSGPDLKWDDLVHITLLEDDNLQPFYGVTFGDGLHVVESLFCSWKERTCTYISDRHRERSERSSSNTQSRSASQTGLKGSTTILISTIFINGPCIGLSNWSSWFRSAGSEEIFETKYSRRDAGALIPSWY